MTRERFDASSSSLLELVAGYLSIRARAARIVGRVDTAEALVEAARDVRTGRAVSIVTIRRLAELIDVLESERRPGPTL